MPELILKSKEHVKHYDKILKVLKAIKALYYEAKLENHIK